MDCRFALFLIPSKFSSSEFVKDEENFAREINPLTQVTRNTSRFLTVLTPKEDNFQFGRGLSERVLNFAANRAALTLALLGKTGMFEAIKTEISCPIFLAKEDLVMKDLVQRLNQSVCSEDKEVVREEFAGEIDDYLSCENFDPQKSECRTCQAVNKLRKESIWENYE